LLGKNARRGVVEAQTNSRAISPPLLYEGNASRNVFNNETAFLVEGHELKAIKIPVESGRSDSPETSMELSGIKTCFHA